MAGEESHESAAADELQRTLSRHLNRLNDGDANARKRAAEAIRVETVDKHLPGPGLQHALSVALKPLLKRFTDPVERCREAAIRTVTELLRCAPAPEDALPCLMPALAQRLGVKEIQEPSEELRLAMLELLGLVLEVCGGGGSRLAPYLDEAVRVLQWSITDPFPDAKIESCRCAVRLARCLPEHFHMQAESLVKPLMQTICHQRSRVRVAATEATGAVVRYGTGKNVEEVLPYLTQRLFDDSLQVRKAVTVAVGDWLLNLPDRYSYFQKLIPLLLSSFHDEFPEIKTLACDLWGQVGTQWEKENEEDLKDKMDFLLSPPVWYPPGVERPCLGCRELVVRNLSRLLPALSHDAADWQAQTRVKSAQLLQVLVLHAEDHCTQHLQPLLSTLQRTCVDPEHHVRAHCLESARLLGFFVSPEIFLKLLLPHVESPSSSSSPWAPLMVLSAVLRGSARPALRPHLPHITDTLALPDVCQQYTTTEYLEQLLACVQTLLDVCEEDCAAISLQLLKVLVTIQSLSTEQELVNKVEECVGCVCGVLGLSSVCELYRLHMSDLLRWLSASQRCWTSYSVQKTQLEIIALQSGPVVGEFLPELVPLLQTSLEPSRDAELRLHVFTMLSKLLLNASNTVDSQGRFGEYVGFFLQELILPSLVWSAGRTAAAVRTAALSCLLALLHGGAVSAEQVLRWEPKLSTQLVSALEEDSQLARVYACRSLTSLMKITVLNPDTLMKIYPELLKRVDDSKDDVRVEALKALTVWFSCLKKSDDTHTHRSHLQFLFQQLLLYLDDPDLKVQPIVLDVLKAGGLVDSVLLQQEVEAVKAKQQNSEYYAELLQYLQSL